MMVLQESSPWSGIVKQLDDIWSQLDGLQGQLDAMFAQQQEQTAQLTAAADAIRELAERIPPRGLIA
ncbi:MAG TPA: hypothetical protein VFO16_14035 [Pseudonocardiaceae bacterium]|nr:hypothetical protein [Pseudonocardiaceae bacterium]